MNKKTKTIAGIIIIILLVCSAFVAYNYYSNLKDREEFNSTIKNASNLENVTDQNYYDLYAKGSEKTENLIVFFESKIDNNTQIINNLTEFKNKTSNETYKEYLTIEINRLQAETDYHKQDLKYAQSYKQYKDGDISASQMRSISSDVLDEQELYVGQGEDYKQEAVDFLKEHPELNETLIGLDIDEDFNQNELDGAGESEGIRFT